MSKTKPQLGSRLVRAGLASAAVTAAVVSTASAPALAAAAALTLNSAVGPAATAATVTAQSATVAWLSGYSSAFVTVSIPTCKATYDTTASTAVAPSSATAGNIIVGTTFTKLSDYKAMIALPNTLTVVPNTATSTKYNICVYASNTANDPLLGQAAYSVAGAIGLTSILPVSGPALGGTTVTVTGTGFPTAKGSISGTLGGAALENVTPVGATSFTFTTPYHTSSTTPVALAVTTAAGTKTLATAFTYANGITIAPNTAPNSRTAVYVDVQGAGFSGLTWGVTALPANTPSDARVLLVDGVFNDDVTGNNWNGGVADCTGVTVISDSELICHMDLNAGGLDATDPTNTTPTDTVVPNGTYTLTVVSDATPDATAAATTAGDPLPTKTDLSSGSTFTVSDY